MTRKLYIADRPGLTFMRYARRIYTVNPATAIEDALADEPVDAKFISNPTIGWNYILFNSEEDYVAFFLRWNQ
jgi:hypothetical protein